MKLLNFKVPYAKRFLYLGIALLTLGSLILFALPLLVQPETLISTSIDTTTAGSYFSDKFNAEKGYWLDFNINTNASSTLHIAGQAVGEVFTLDANLYKYTVRISRADVYQIQVENKAGHWYWFSWVPEDNHISGNFYLRRTLSYLPQIIFAGGVLLAVGFLIIPSMVYVEYRARQRAKSLYECPRCKREVSIGLQVCPYCKLDLTKYWVRCKYCNKFFDSRLGKCPKCGAEAEM